MLLQEVKFVSVPERTLAIRIPSIKPETTIDSAVARRLAGARSPTSGNISCGVTVDTATKNDTAEKTAKDFVTHRITLSSVS
jgi:hypothetical protein